MYTRGDPLACDWLYNPPPMEFVDAGAAGDLLEGAIRCVEIEGRRIALYHTGDGIFATDERCPHRGGPLAEGELMRNEIICPWHFWSFDIRTGKHPELPMRVVTHQVKIEAGRILIRLSADQTHGPELP